MAWHISQMPIIKAASRNKIRVMGGSAKHATTRIISTQAEMTLVFIKLPLSSAQAEINKLFRA